MHLSSGIILDKSNKKNVNSKKKIIQCSFGFAFIFYRLKMMFLVLH